MPIITGPAGMDPVLGEMRTIDISGGTGGGGSNYTFNSSEFTVSIAGLVSLNEVPGNKVTGSVSSATNATNATNAVTAAGLADTAVAYRLNVSSGAASFNPIANIVNATGATVTLEPDTAYKVQATTSAVTLNANTPASGQWGLEGHIELFVAGTGYVVTGSNVVLANALEPDAVNNCTVRFHDGLAIISVEDHVAGYIVTVNAASGAGSLAYGLATATNEYISVDASLNGQTLDLGGAVTNGEKHVVGNGYTETIVSGGINCTSKTTLSNLEANGVVVSSGTLTLRDVYIPNGSTVAVSGGGLAIEKVTGNGGVIDLGGTNTPIARSGAASASGCTFANGSTTYGGAVHVSAYASAVFIDCVYSGNIATAAGGAMFVAANATVTLSSCSFDNNSGPTAVYGRAIYANGPTMIKNCAFGTDQTVTVANGYAVNLDGTFKTASVVNGSGSAIITSGAILDLTGNTNATPIAPGGGITFAEGGATVYPSAGQASAYMLGGMTVPTIGNTNVVNLGESNCIIASSTANVDGCVVTGGAASSGVIQGGAFYITSNGTVNLSGATVTGNFATNNGGGVGLVTATSILNCTNSYIKGNSSLYGAGKDIWIFKDATAVASNCQLGIVSVDSGGSLSLSGSNTIDLVTTYTSGFVTVTSGAILDLTGNTNATPIAPGGGVIVDGGCTVINSAGASVSIAGGTYTKINNDGTTN